MPVISFGKEKYFPAFYTRKSGFSSIANFENVDDCAKLISMGFYELTVIIFLESSLDLNLNSGVVIAVPIPEQDEIPNPENLDLIITESVKKAE